MAPGSVELCSQPKQHQTLPEYTPKLRSVLKQNSATFIWKRNNNENISFNNNNNNNNNNKYYYYYYYYY